MALELEVRSHKLEIDFLTMNEQMTKDDGVIGFRSIDGGVLFEFEGEKFAVDW